MLPPGVKNLITPGGALRIRAELENLAAEELRLRGAVANGDAEASRLLQALALRVQQIQRILHTAVVTGPPAIEDGAVRFGATISVRERSGEEAAYRIVGVDETDLDRNWVSWMSPIAKVRLAMARGNPSSGENARGRGVQGNLGAWATCANANARVSTLRSTRLFTRSAPP